MAKWADYGISAVRFNIKHTHIDRVRVRSDNGDTFGSPVDHSRQQVVDAIEAGTTYVTIIKSKDDKWEKGQKVIIVEINGAKYLKTTKNETEKDNLDKLPEY
ncbi:MAG: DUF3892 domain-containing protein [Acidobacteriia bacterium]|nr:DUF3892 domain-containing protein [Terriglobia bacterium]